MWLGIGEYPKWEVSATLFFAAIPGRLTKRPLDSRIMGYPLRASR